MRFLVALMAMLAVASPALAQRKSDPQPASAASPLPATDPVPTAEDLWHLRLSTGGTVVIALRPDKAPNHVARIRQLTRAGFYDGLTFHRVIDGFMAQTGDPLNNGEGGSPLPNLAAEFNDLPHVRGVVSMARATARDSANSQFFILFMPTLRLDTNYTALGRVQSGMQFVDAIKRGEGDNGSVTSEPSTIVRAWIEADGEAAPRVPLPAVALPAAPAAAPVPAPTAPAPAPVLAPAQ